MPVDTTLMPRCLDSPQYVSDFENLGELDDICGNTPGTKDKRRWTRLLNSKRRLPFIVCQRRKTNFCYPFFPFAANKRKFSFSVFRLKQTNGTNEKRQLPFSVCSPCKRKFVVCPFVDEETNGNYPFANGLNRLNGINGIKGFANLLGQIQSKCQMGGREHWRPVLVEVNLVGKYLASPPLGDG